MSNNMDPVVIVFKYKIQTKWNNELTFMKKAKMH